MKQTAALGERGTTMTAVEKIACRQGRRDEGPNIALAEALCLSRDKKGVREIVAGLRDPDENVQSDCIKVLYEIGHRQPALIAPYVDKFAFLLNSRRNRLIWGGMAALAAAASLKPRETYAHIDLILKAFARGSVITVDNGVTVLASLSAAVARYEKKLWPVIVRHLESCRPKELPQHAERAAAGVNRRNVASFRGILERRLEQLSGPQKKRVQKILETVDRKDWNGVRPGKSR
jgi:hypothetical protein